MRKTFNKILAALMVLAMVFTLLPVQAFAAEHHVHETPSTVAMRSFTGGNYVIAANVNGVYYALPKNFDINSGKIDGVQINVTNGSVSAAAAENYTVTIASYGSNYTIYNGSRYLKYTSGTNLSTDTNPYEWKITTGTNGSYRIESAATTGRAILFRAGSYHKFGGYATSNATATSQEYFDLELVPVSGSGDSGDTPSTIVSTANISNGSYVIAANVGGTYYAMANTFASKIPGTVVTVSGGTISQTNASAYVVTITKNGSYHTISNGGNYLAYASGTSLKSSTTAYDWAIVSGTNGTYRAIASTENSRCLALQNSSTIQFGAYATSNVTAGATGYYDIELIPISQGGQDTTIEIADGEYVIAAKVNGTYYAMSSYFAEKIDGTGLTVENGCVTTEDAEGFAVTITGSGEAYTITNSGGYLRYSSGTNLSFSATNPYEWTISRGVNGTYRINAATSGRALSFRADTYFTFGGYSTGNITAGSESYYDVEILSIGNPADYVVNCGHNTISTTQFPATCLESGMLTKTCTTCGTIVSWKSMPALGHSIVYTSNSDGTHTVTCSACDYTEGTTNCIYSNLACYLCGSPEPENDYSGRYYFATVRSGANSTYHYMTFDLIGANTKRYASEDSGLTSLPSVITAPISNKVYVIEKNEEGTYRIFAEGLAGDNCLAWEVDANASENSGAFADTFNAYELTIGLSGEASGGNKIVNIYFVENEVPRYLSLNNTTGNNYFAWYTNASSQRKDIVLVPVEGEATCLHTNRTTVTQEPTCVSNGKETIYCADCGAIVGENELISGGHAFKYEWIEEGWHQVICTNCDYSLTEACSLVGEYCIYCSGGELECFQLVTDPSQLTSSRYVIISKAIGGNYVGDYDYYGIGLQQDSNHNALSSFGMAFDELPTEIYLEGIDTINLVWTMTGTNSGFTLKTDEGESLYHNSGDDLFLGDYTATNWTADFSTTEGHFAVKHNGAYLALRTDLDTLNDSDIYSPLVKCAGNTDTGNYKMFFYKKYDGCLHQNTSVSLQEPTCTTSGYEKVTCLDCGEVVTSDVLPALGHDPFSYEATEPTCTESGNLTYWYCADCDCYFSDELCSKKTTQEAIAIPALGHKWDDGQITKDATCTSTGLMTYICYTCTTSKTEDIPAAGHFYTRIVTPPTCTEQGYTTFTCSGCGDSYKANYTTAFGHAYSYTNNGNGTHRVGCTRNCGYSAVENCNYVDGKCVCGATGQAQSCTHSSTTTNTVPATCTTSGYIKVTCNICGVVVSTKTLSPTGHSYTSSVTAPTCTTQGYTTYTCHCGYSYKSNYVAVLGHSYTTKVVAPTCASQGYTIYSCIRCTYSYNSNYVTSLAHNYTYKNNTNGTHTITCPNGCGYNVTQNCSYVNGWCVCGAAEPEVCKHTSQTTATVPATCTEDGLKTVTCDTCGEVISKTVIPATGHVIVAVAAKPATCTEDGCNKHWVCTGCNSYYADQNGQYSLPESFVIIKATGHNFVSGICTKCGATEAPVMVYDSTLAVNMSIGVGAEMQVTYNIPNSRVKNFKSFYLEVSKNVAGGEPVKTVFSVANGNLTPSYNTSGAVSRYSATYTGIAAKEMGDIFSATIYAVATDGSIHYGPANASSIKQYLMSQLNDTSAGAELKTLAVDMLHYGAAAQINFAYDTQNPVNADLTAAQLALGTQKEPTAVNGFSQSATGCRVNTSVSIGSKVELYLTFIYKPTATSKMELRIKNTKGTVIDILTPAYTVGANYKAIYDNVGAKQMRDLITIELYDNGTLVSKSTTWSVESYVAQVIANTSSSPELVAVCKAMLTYGDAAAAYLEATGQ